MELTKEQREDTRQRRRALSSLPPISPSSAPVVGTMPQRKKVALRSLGDISLQLELDPQPWRRLAAGENHRSDRLGVIAAS